MTKRFQVVQNGNTVTLEKENRKIKDLMEV